MNLCTVLLGVASSALQHIGQVPVYIISLVRRASCLACYGRIELWKQIKCKYRSGIVLHGTICVLSMNILLCMYVLRYVRQPHPNNIGTLYMQSDLLQVPGNRRIPEGHIK